MKSNSKKWEQYKRGRHRGHYLACLDFLTLQDKHNIHTLSVNIKLIYTRCVTVQKKLAKGHVFLPEERF